MATPKVLLAICMAVSAWSFSFGLGTQVITHWLKARDASNTVIGLNHSIYYLGIALASLLVPWLTKKLGNACSTWGMVLSGLTLALFPWGGGWAGWFGLRFLSGVAGAMCLVPLETMISSESAPNRCARNFSFYGVALTLGGALGIWAGLHWYRPGSAWPFFAGGLLPLAAGLMLHRMLPVAVTEPAVSTSMDSTNWARNFLSYGTAWFQGFLEGGMLAFLSLYLISLGMTADAAGDLMSVTMVGVIAFQVPVAWLADRFGRMPMLLVCYGVVGGCLVLVPVATSSLWLVICLFLLGACSGALYPLALALIGERLPKAALARAYALFLAMECIGSQVGAALMGQARDWWGEASMFGAGLAALATVLTIWILLNVWRGTALMPSGNERRPWDRAIEPVAGGIETSAHRILAP